MKNIVVFCIIVTIVYGAYTPSIARKLGIAETATYSTPQQIRSWTCKYCSQYPLQNTKAFSNPIVDIYGFTGFSAQDNAIIAAFRGTVDIQNWIANLDFAQIKYQGCSGCYVHQGFYNAFQTIEGYLRKDIQDLLALHSGAQIFVTGFSLGGALATVAALDIKQIFGRVDQFYTFGQPRVGNDALARYFESKITNRFRVIHYADIVPHVPPQLPIAYSHFASQIWYDEKMQKYKTCGAQDFTCSKSLLPNQWSTDDHNLQVYIKLPTQQQFLRFPMAS